MGSEHVGGLGPSATKELWWQVPEVVIDSSEVDPAEGEDSDATDSLSSTPRCRRKRQERRHLQSTSVPKGANKTKKDQLAVRHVLNVARAVVQITTMKERREDTVCRIVHSVVSCDVTSEIHTDTETRLI